MSFFYHLADTRGFDFENGIDPKPQKHVYGVNRRKAPGTAKFQWECIEKFTQVHPSLWQA